jgi:iron complex transport system ATP-binding protein
MIQTNNLVCGYGKKIILSDVNLQITPGEITSLLGKNGAGKTTLFKTILGLLPPLSGEVIIEGKELNKYAPHQLAKCISYVPQAHGTPFPFTVFDVVLMGQYSNARGFLKLPNHKSREIALKSMEMLDIIYLKDKFFSALSGGEKQMVLIARAIAQQPGFIAMDEPTSNLDLGNQMKVLKMVTMLKDEGYGIVMNTHCPEQALNYSDQVILLQNQQVTRQGKPGEILTSKTISRLYGTEIELTSASTSRGLHRKICMAIGF